MDKLTLEEAKKINGTMVTEDHLILHAANVSAAMGGYGASFRPGSRGVGGRGLASRL